MSIAVTQEMVEDRPALVLASEQVYVTETETGLIFREDTPIDVWSTLTARLIRAHKRLEFALADAINFGRGYGERYANWVHDTQLSASSLNTISYVGRQIEVCRRRQDISFAHHAEVASLPPKMQDSLLGLAVENGWKREDIRDAARTARRQIKAAERALLPTPTITDPDMRILVGDARSLNVESETVDLVVTSPPYALAKAYTGGDVVADDWQDFMLEWLTEAHRVARIGARLAVNVPLDTSPEYGSRPTYAETLLAARRAGWVYRSTIVWHDDQLGKSTARGSLDSASSPYIYFPGEMILLMQKGPEWGRSDPENRGGIDHQRWLDWTNGYWRISGESNAWEDHPAPFPVEVPRRLIELLSFYGDLVLDPFTGSGSTAVAAFDVGRRFYGVDASETYVKSAIRRVAR
jgi:site-specific DNA-methyltransferase (adenine-specific)